MTNLVHIAHALYRARVTTNSECTRWHYCRKARTIGELSQAKNATIRAVQEETYLEYLSYIRNNEELPKGNSVLSSTDIAYYKLATESVKQKLGQTKIFPLLSQASTTLHCCLWGTTMYKRDIKDASSQKEPSRPAGFWLVVCERCVSRSIHNCITCRRPCGPTQIQKMSNLSADRLVSFPTFTNIGLDVFGPWSISSHRTRGGPINSKRWAVIFTCVGSRCVQFEVIEPLNTSSFINAVRRFFVRGSAKHICSDRGPVL